MLFHGSSRTIATALAAAIGLVAVIGTTASAAVPANDDRASASVVGDLPFTDSLDTTDATGQPNDPDCVSDGSNPTVWYTFTPADDGSFVASTGGSDYDTTLVVATPGEGGLDIVACNDDWGDSFDALIVWQAAAGQEYLVMAGSFSDEVGQLRIEIRRAPPPPSFVLRVARKGSLTSRGAAEVRGILRCQGTQERQHLEVSGRQDAARRIIRGFGARQVACGEPWTVRVRNGDFRFADGTLEVRAVLDWCSVSDCGRERVRRVVRIR